MYNVINKGLLVVVVLIVISITGCEGGLMRFPPSETIKQSAELTNQLAQKINREGTEPQSPASQRIVQGTLVALNYTGRPKEQPDPEQFDTIVQQAQPEAEQRPDVWEVTDAILELCIGVGGLAGGAGVLKFVKFLADAKAKTTALREVVQGNELFKETADAIAVAAFKKAQDIKQISNGTKLIVAQEKLA